jgi:hypothetical protein
MFDDGSVKAPPLKIPRKPVSSAASPTSATSPAPKDFDQILDNLGHDRRSSEADIQATDQLASGVAILGTAIKRSASVVCSPFHSIKTTE